uniref:Uncharacterized protein n=1 Tax=Megaselia scalaris TaxID=36166 RepID=T1H4I7_MEGSC
MPEDLQKEISCIIGIHYPERVIDLKASLEKNKKSMHKLRDMLMGEGETPAHCRPSNDDEIRQFF